jgi:hypothetical protein
LQIIKTGKFPYFKRKNQVEDNAIEVEIEVAFEVEKSIHYVGKNLLPKALVIGYQLI